MISFSGKTVVFIGDSITAGSSSSDADHRFTTLFSVAKGATEVNMGIGGQVLENGSVCVGHSVFNKTTIPTYSSGTHAALFIALGVNDIGVNNVSMTPAGFQTTLLDAVDYAHETKGWPFSAIVLLTPFWYTQQGYDVYVGSCSVTVAADTARHEAYVAAVFAVGIARSTVVCDTYNAMKNSEDPASLISEEDGIHPLNPGHALLDDFLEAQAFEPIDSAVNVLGGRPNIGVAKKTVSFACMGISVDNTAIIYLVGDPMKSFQPGRTINAIDGFEAGKGYYIVPIQDLKLGDLLIPPIAL